MAASALPSTGTGHGRIGGGFIQTLSPSELDVQVADKQRSRFADPKDMDEQTENSLVSYIRQQWEMMRRHRSSSSGWNTRLLEAQRTFNREYSASKLAEIKQFGGSEIYAGITATKCRGTTSLLREVYLETEKPWGLDPTPEPTLPESIENAIKALVEAEMQSMEQANARPTIEQVQDRLNTLVEHARRAAKKTANDQAKRAEEKVNDFLVEGAFYEALADFLVDLPIFPFACIKGPVVRVVPTVKWVKGGDGGMQAVSKDMAKMFWNRVSPFDLYFTPGVSDIRDANVIEIERLIRSDLNALIGVPGYKEEAIRGALRDYGRRGLHEWRDETESERAAGENRENPNTNDSGVIDCLEFHGSVQGSLLLDWGMDKKEIEDADLDYFVQVWVVGRYVIKAQIHPNPRKRHPYYITSMEKVPGTPVGNALPDILGDIQDAGNATLRAFINNQAMASGPQVVVNTSRIQPGEDPDSIFPWKRWKTVDDPFNPQNTSQPPVTFFQPQSNAAEHMTNYEKLNQMADELSAIPRYITGSDRMGGAGRTASGLAMLMGNANKILKTVCSNIDREVIKEAIQGLYDFVLLMDKSGMFRGDENIVVRGVQVAVQKETNRQRQMELLQGTNNPTDNAIMGPLGRRNLLAAVSEEVGLPGEDIVPDEDTLKAQLAQAAQQQKEQIAAAQAQAIQQDGEKSVTRPGNSGTAPQGANTDLGVPEGDTMRSIVQ